MMNYKFDLKLAWWQLRGQPGKIWLLIICLSLGVSVRVAIHSFLRQVNQTIVHQSRNLLTADLEIASRDPLTREQETELNGLLPKGSKIQKQTNFFTMASAPATKLSRLVEVRAIEKSYPFYGELSLSEDASFEKLFGPELFVVVQPELLAQLGIKAGDRIRVGRSEFQVAGTILKEPGIGSTMFSLGPRILIGIGQVPKTGLVDMKSRVYYSTLVSLPDSSQTELVSTRLKKAWGLPESRMGFSESAGPKNPLQVRTFYDKQQQVGRFFDRFGDYMRLVSLIALLLAGIGAGSVAHSFVTGYLESAAILRTLGATNRRMFRNVLFQVLILAASGSVLGALLGSALKNFFSAYFSDIVPAAVQPQWDAAAMSQGILLGLLVSAYFGISPILKIRNVKPMMVLRGNSTNENIFSNTKQDRLLSWFLPLSGVLAFIILSVIESSSLKKGLSFSAMVFAGSLLIYSCGRYFLSRLARWRPEGWAGFGFKHGLANLGRPGLRPHFAVVTLGLSVLLLAILSIYQYSLFKELSPEQPARAVNFFLIDIQDEQVNGLSGFLKGQNISRFVLSPMVKARYRNLNGKKVAQEKALTREGESEQFLRNREQNLSYRHQLGENESLVQGEWMKVDPASLTGGHQPETSLEERFAGRLGAKLGDFLTFDVQGVELTAQVTSIRKVRWSSFLPTFFILISPWALEDAPKTWVGTISGLNPELKTSLQSDLIKLFPSITLLDVAQTAQRILTILQQISGAIKFVALFSLGSGLLVLIGIALSTARQRQTDALLLRLLGAGQKTIFLSISTEFAFLGAVSGGTALLLSLGLGWVLIEHFFGIPFQIPWQTLLLIGSGSTVLCAVTGLAACRKVFQGRPVDLLRQRAE